MRDRTLPSLIAILILTTPAIAAAKPPAHAPAHGYRTKQAQVKSAPAHESRNGIEFIFDSDAQWMDERGPVPFAEAISLAVPIAEGLQFLHQKGIVHRDIKLTNILLTQDVTPKIGDFGLAKLMESSLHTREGSLLGSPRYMSPEQAAEKMADRRSDIYAFGITLYEMLASRAPFEGDVASLLAQHITQPPEPLSILVNDFPADLERIAMKMLSKDPSERPQDLAEFIEQGLTFQTVA